MYGTPDRALYVLDNAVQVRERADALWRAAIREAIASRTPIEQVAAQARTTIENVLTIINER